MRSNHAINKTSKLAKAVISKATNVRVYSLSNNFSGEPMTETPVHWVGVDTKNARIEPCDQQTVLTENLRQIRSARLYNQGDKFVIHVHSNLWYEFESDGSLYDKMLCMRPSFILRNVLTRLYSLPFENIITMKGETDSLDALEELVAEFEKAGR